MSHLKTRVYTRNEGTRRRDARRRRRARAMARRRTRDGAARVAVACVALVVARSVRATTTASCAAMLDDDDDAPRTTYSSARRAESREVRYGTSWNASGETRAREDGVTLRLTAPPWCGSTRALALALERELASDAARGGESGVGTTVEAGAGGGGGGDRVVERAAGGVLSWRTRAGRACDTAASGARRVWRARRGR